MAEDSLLSNKSTADKEIIILFYSELDETIQEIIKFYAPALSSIGVDFSRLDVEEAIGYCSQELEDAFRTVISYWYWTQQNGEEFVSPSDFLVKAIQGNWHPYNWYDDWMKNPLFKSPGMRWWDEAAVQWGRDTRNSLVADIQESWLRMDNALILFMNGRHISLHQAQRMGWDKVLEYAKAGRYSWG